MTEREQVLTERLLTVLSEHLGQEPGEGSRVGLVPRSPTMLAAWANATSTRRKRRATAHWPTAVEAVSSPRGD